MPALQRLSSDHAPAVLAFELANRAYFAASISDRGDEFFDQFTERYNTLLAEQEAGLYGLRRLSAATSHLIVASQKVLLNTGFVAVGPAEPADLGGKTGTWYERVLVSK